MVEAVKDKIYVSCAGCGVGFLFDIDTDVNIDSELREAVLKYAFCEGCELENERKRKQDEYEKNQQIKKAVNLELADKRRRESRITENLLPWDSEHKKANLKLYNWVWNNRHKSIWLSGLTGIGKTRIMQNIGFQLCSEMSVQFWTATDLLDTVSAQFASSKPSGPERLSRGQRYLYDLFNVELLVIDDLDKVAWTDAKSSRLVQIVDQRYIRNSQRDYQRRPGTQIWITTNDDGTRLIAGMGENKAGPVLRRIENMCEEWKNE